MKHTKAYLSAIKNVAVSTSLLASASLLVLATPLAVFADEYDAQIKALQNEVSGYQQQAAALHGQAQTLQAAVNGLQAQQNAILADIHLNEVKLQQLLEQIAANERKLVQQQAVLSSTISSLYVDGQVTPIEMLASSGTLGDFLDQQEYRASVSDQIKASIKKVKQLRLELDTQRTDVEHTLADQNARQSDLAAKKAEQADLLAKTQGQEAAYQDIIGQKNNQITQLQAEQVAANRRLSGGANVVPGDPNHGGYPTYLANAPQDSIVDPWGMYNRECVSYTAWKVQQTKGYMPYWGGRGNANQWPSSAQADGIPTGSTPRAGSVGIWMTGYYGHAFWVESVNSNGTINVSQYNYDFNGYYSEMTINSSGVIYIYF